MKNHFINVIIIVGLMILPISLNGQTVNTKQVKTQLAVQEAETILHKADRIMDLLAMVRLKSKAANLLWTRQPDESREVFIKLWDTIDKRTDDNSFEEEEARSAVLQYLFPKDRKLANQLLRKLAKNNKEDISDFETTSGRSKETRRLALLSHRVAETDVVLAAYILEQSLTENTHPTASLVLSRIREKNPLLANYVVSQAIENSGNLPRTLALHRLGVLTGYLFPFTPMPAISSEVMESDENLRQQFTLAGYQILKDSLTETNEFLTNEQKLGDKSKELRVMSLALVAGTLAVLSTRYAPEHFVELNAIANRLIINVPKSLVGLVQAQIAAVKGAVDLAEKSDVSETEIINALAKEDFSAAENLIAEIKDENKKKFWTQTLLKAQSKAYLIRGELLKALNTTRKIDDANQKLLLLVEVAKAAHKKQDESLSIDVLQEAQKVSAESLPKGLNAQTLFSLAAETAYFLKPQAMQMLQTSVETINSIPELKKDDEKSTFRGETYWNDTNNFLNSPAMIRAFGVLGEMNIEETLLIAGRLKNNSVQMMARLATVEKVLKKSIQKAEPSLSPKTKK